MPEIAGWLDNLGMSEYAEHFAENKIDVRQRAAADGAGDGGDVEPQLLLIDEPAVWAALRPASENDLATGTALDAAKNLIRYHHLVNTTTSLVIEETNRHVTIDTTFRPGLEGFEKDIAEWGTTTFVAELRRLTDTRIVPQSLSFIHRRNSGTKEFREFFGCPVRFGANRQSIVFATMIFRRQYILPTCICSTSSRFLAKKRSTGVQRPRLQPAPRWKRLS